MSTMLRQIPADDTDRSLILAAEEFERLLMFLTEVPSSSSTQRGPFVQFEETGFLRQATKGPVDCHAAQGKRPAALGAEATSLALGDAWL